jgi:hypothetical protein
VYIVQSSKPLYGIDVIYQIISLSLIVLEAGALSVD